ncbi:MAG: ATP-binding protein, partial [Candidatus Latescibacterota bacterium]
VDRLSREPEEEKDGAIIIDWNTQTQRTIQGYREFYDNADSHSVSAASPRDAVITSRLGRLYDESYVVLRVSDAGIGIPEDEVRFLGEPFRQASNAPDQQAKGKALGLAVVQKIISDCRGHLCCRSKERVGTTFSVFIPLVHP